MKITDLRRAAVACLAIGIVAAQQPTRTNLVGVVQSIDAASGQIVLHTDPPDAKDVKILPHAGAKLLRLPPGEKSLAKATPITAQDIGVGDRVLARGELSDDKSAMAASTLVVMNKAELAKKQQADQAEWQKRGVTGLVTTVDPKAGEVTINTRTAEGMKPLVVVAGEKTTVSRYAPDSVKFADAKPSTLADIKPGDQVRALGAKSEDGTHYAAEELVSGSFRNVAATVTSIDPAANTMKVMDLTTKKPLLVHVNADSTMRKLPETVARMIAMRAAGGAGGAGGAATPGGPGGGGGNGQSAGAAQHPQGAPGAGNGQTGGSGGMRSGGMQQMLDHMPAIKLEDLKPGDAIIVSSTEGADPGQVTAITLVAGVEPILTAAPAGSQRARMLGSWNLDMDMGGGGMQ
jgi:Cu/Ag efflux protein CusF